MVVDDAGVPDTILTDEVALTSILRNLLSNGIKYTDQGEVRLSARVLGPRLELTVADTGIGIPAGLYEHVFEEFYQVPGIRRGGTGLGLPYARRLARILGGDLALTSEPGAGTTVVLNLPHRTPAVGTVVLADDDASFRQLLRGLLTGIADRCIEAEDGGQALAFLAGNPADLVLADLRMPGTDGSALLARLPAAIPVIVITGADAPPPPRRRRHAAQGRAHQGTAGIHHPRRPWRCPVTDVPAVLLLVDDDEAKRYVMATWLRRAGHTVIEVATGREALAQVGTAELVLLDVHLPDISGFEVCRQIKGDPRTAAIPVIQVSATAVGVSDRAQGLTQGADAYLVDPVEPEELLAVVMAALRYYRARQRAERTASLLTALTSVALDINAAATFDGLARVAAAGAARIFAGEAVLILEHARRPDPQDLRVARSIPSPPSAARRPGWPTGRRAGARPGQRPAWPRSSRAMTGCG